MKRRALAICASLLIVALIPGSTLAIPPTSNLDQSNEPSGSDWGGGQTMAQTFTAGKTGMLSKVGLSLAIDGSESVDVNIEGVDGSAQPDGSIVATSYSDTVSGSSDETNAWYYFSFAPPLSVTANSQYAIVLSTSNVVWYAVEANPYHGGQAFTSGGSTAGPWTQAGPGGNDDWTFRTYVDTASTVLQWDKPQVTAGTGTPLTLTATMTYANGAEANNYKALLGLVPSWFAAGGLTCSDTASEIVQTDCTLANFEAGFPGLIPASATGDSLTFVLTGTATPALTDVGTPGTAGGDACVNYPAVEIPQIGARPAPAQAPTSVCGDGTATVQVVAPAATPGPTTSPAASLEAATAAPTAAPTPPPTSTSGSTSGSSGGTIWFLPFALVAALGGLLLLADRRRRRTFQG